MKNFVIATCSALFLISCQTKAQESLNTPTPPETPKVAAAAGGLSTEEKEISNDMVKPNLYSYVVKDIDGNDFSFEKLKGKKILIVNTASKCGFTPQYEELEKLYQKIGKDKLVIVGFPANDFGQQEPGMNSQIKEFCTKNYGVTFPMMSKVSVKGAAMCELYKFLTQKSKNGLQDSQVEWNFQKYLINERGELVKVFPSKTTPFDPELMSLLR
jgi:glutathione peroxidase